MLNQHKLKSRSALSVALSPPHPCRESSTRPAFCSCSPQHSLRVRQLPGTVVGTGLSGDEDQMIPASKELRVKVSFQCELTLASSVLYWMVSGLHTCFPGRHWGSQVSECTGCGETPGAREHGGGAGRLCRGVETAL